MELLRRITRIISSKKQLLFRLVLVWLLGLLVFNYDERNSFDLRFQMRAPQHIAPNIVIVNLGKKTWDRLMNPSFPSMLQSARPLSDSYFWSTPIWRQVLSNLTKASPKVILVDLFFDRSIPMPSYIENSFKQRGVIWRAEPDQRFGYKRPRFSIDIKALDYSSKLSLANVGLGYVFRDYDYTARRYKRATHIPQLKDMADKVASIYNGKGSAYIENQKPFINFRGPQGTYPILSIESILSGTHSPDFFKDKIVIIGSDSMEKHFVKTAAGFMTRSEYNANLIDNIINNLWIKAFPFYSYSLYLLLIVILCFCVLHFFKQGLAIACLILMAVGTTAYSIVLFDIYNIWIPVVSPIAVIVLSYLILLSYLLAESEYQAWSAQKKEESLREMNELKNNFVSLFSHDLKTPLAKIHAISDKVIQQKDAPTDTIKKEISKIQSETQELDRYIQSILQVTRIEAGEFNLNIVPQDINELISVCIQNLQPLAQTKNIKIDFQEEPLFPVEMDASLIKEVFINLIDNSIKYCPENSFIKISSLDKETHVEVKFEDNGPGIPENEQAAIFEKFYRASGTQMNKKGTGLGLYLVRYFIEIHDGEVALKSSPGEGTLFTIRLPYEQKKEN